MNRFPLFVFCILIFVGSCSPADTYQKHRGLTFKNIDWLNDEKLERPFLITSEVSQSCDENTKRLYLPAKLFKNSSIEYVYFENMKSTTVEFVDGEKPRYKITFNLKENHLEDSPYQLEPDQAVVGIKLPDHQKVIKIEDIRVPFYTKPGV